MIENRRDGVTTRFYVAPCAEAWTFCVETSILQSTGGGAGGVVTDPDDGGDD